MKLIDKFDNLKYLIEQSVIGLKNLNENTKTEFNYKINAISEKQN